MEDALNTAWLVCFDISDNACRHRIGKLLLGYGARVQKSVFEIVVKSAEDMSSLQQGIRKLLDEETEVRFYRLCLSCRKE